MSRHRAIDRASATDYSVVIPSALAGTFLSCDRDTSPCTQAKWRVGCLPNTWRLAHVLPARDAGASRPPSSACWQVRRTVYGDHQISPDLGTPVTEASRSHATCALPPLPCGRLRTRTTSYVRTIRQGGMSPVCPLRFCARCDACASSTAFVHVCVQTPPCSRLAGCHAAGPARSRLDSC